MLTRVVLEGKSLVSSFPSQRGRVMGTESKTKLLIVSNGNGVVRQLAAQLRKSGFSVIISRVGHYHHAKHFQIDLTLVDFTVGQGGVACVASTLGTAPAIALIMDDNAREDDALWQVPMVSRLGYAWKRTEGSEALATVAKQVVASAA